MKMKIMTMNPEQKIWHFICCPTRSRPFQLMTMYPIMTPIIPYRAVDAPAFTPDGLTSALKMLPPMPESR